MNRWEADSRKHSRWHGPSAWELIILKLKLIMHFLARSFFLQLSWSLPVLLMCLHCDIIKSIDFEFISIQNNTYVYSVLWNCNPFGWTYWNPLFLALSKMSIRLKNDHSSSKKGPATDLRDDHSRATQTIKISDLNLPKVLTPYSLSLSIAFGFIFCLQALIKGSMPLGQA